MAPHARNRNLNYGKKRHFYILRDVFVTSFYDSDTFWIIINIYRT